MGPKNVLSLWLRQKAVLQKTLQRCCGLHHGSQAIVSGSFCNFVAIYITEIPFSSEMTDAFFSPKPPAGMESFELEQKVPHHPVVTAAHLFFKIGALVTYLTASFGFPDAFVIPFIVTVIFIALDFWVVKNISGRLLVGLRWWNEVKADGSNEWIFESLEKTAITNPLETKIFWGGLLLFPVVWLAFLLKQIITFTFDWAILCAIGFFMSGANVTGYIKCARDARKQVTDMATKFVVEQAVSQAVNRV